VGHELHTEIQYRLLKLGKGLNREVWVARSDKSKEFDGEKFSDLALKELPKHLGFDEEGKEIISNIDVIWFNNNKIDRAFEIEVTTSIYSGILRLSDLLAAMPNINFPIYIVSPNARKKDVQQQLLRPTFKHLKLNERCKYIESEELFKKYDSLVFSENPQVIDKISTSVSEKMVEPQFAEGALEEGQIWNVFYFEPLKAPNITKKAFFKEHKIKSLLAYAYTTDTRGEITGIVFQGYKSRIDKNMKLKLNCWDTRHEVKIGNLKVNMKVYVLETTYDLDTGERVQKPRLRMLGRLKEVWREKNGKKIEKLFP